MMRGTSRGSSAHEHDVARFDRDVGAGADRDADVGRQQRGRVVHAVADHRHPLPLRLELLDLVQPSRSGSTSANTVSIPRSRATASATGRASPVIITTSMPRSCSASHRLARFGPDRIRERERREHRRVLGQRRPPCAALRGAVGRLSQASATGVSARSASSAGPPTYSRRPSTVRVDAAPGIAWNASAGGNGAAGVLARSARSRARSVCSESDSTAAASRSASSVETPSAVAMSMMPNSPLRQRAGLVEHNGGEVPRLLEPSAVADEEAAARAERRRDRDHQRDRQARAREGRQ